MQSDLSTLSLLLLNKWPSILENKKEEERGAKVPAKREKSQEDKAAFKKEEVNIIEKEPSHKAQRAVFHDVSGQMISKL